MRFNSQDTALLLAIIEKIIDTLTADQIAKKEQLILIIEKLKQNEYIKGKLLNLLFNVLIRGTYENSATDKLTIEDLIKRIKFKATPR